MSELIIELEKRIGKDNLVEISPKNHDDLPLIIISSPIRSGIKIVMTNGLSNFKMPVPEKFADRSFNELYFCLPSYWEVDFNSPSDWTYSWIQKLAKHVVTKNTWFGPGHTIPNGNPPQALSTTMKQNHFILFEPILLNEMLKPLTISEGELSKTIYFLSIVPIFNDELDYKMGKSTFKFLQKFTAQGNSELLDDFRGSCLKSKWRFFK
jgi:hypothetical protein